MVELGPVTLVVRPVSIGSRVSVLQIEIQKPGPASQGPVPCVLSTVTQGDLSKETGISLPTELVLRKEDIPDRESDCEERIYPPYTKEIAPCTLKVIQRQAKRGGPDTLRSRSIREVWYAFADGTGFDLLSLGYLTDQVSQLYLHL